MKHDLYNQIYKCRLCGKTFCPVTTDGCDTAISNMVNLAGRCNGGKDKYKPLSSLLQQQRWEIYRFRTCGFPWIRKGGSR